MLAKFFSRFGAAALLLAAMSVAASAQVAQATGKVTLKQADGTEVPVQGALVKFYRTDIKQTFEAKTGKNGSYVHAGLPLVGVFTIAVSAPGARPTYIPDVPIGRKGENNFVLDPGDGSALTLEQIKASVASGGAGPAPTTTTTGSAPKLSEEDKKRAEAEAAERKRIEEQNAKAIELNTKLPEILKSGNDAFTAKKYDEAVTFYDQGLALDPTQAVFHRNRAIVLRARGVEKFNTAAKAKDVPGKEAAKEDFKNSAESMEKALTAFRDNASKNASGAPVGMGTAVGQQNEELGYLFDRSESYRVALQTGAQVNTEAAIKAFEEYLAVETDPARKMKGQNGLGDALFMGGKMDESIATFRQVIAKNPENLDAMTGLATALAAKGSMIEGSGGTAMISEARDLFQEFIKKAPDNHPKKATAVETAQYLDETLKAANAPKPSTGGRNTGSGRKRP